MDTLNILLLTYLIVLLCTNAVHSDHFHNVIVVSIGCLLVQAAIGSDLEQYIAAPAGIQFHEVTASCLVKVNSSGSLVDSASMSLAPTKATFSLAVAMHAARNDVKSVVFLCHPSAVSVSILIRVVLADI